MWFMPLGPETRLVPVTPLTQPAKILSENATADGMESIRKVYH